MIDQFISKLQNRFKNDRDFTLFIFVGIFMGVASGIYNTVFSNYLNQVYHLSEAQRGFVEFPRELPGATIMIVLAILAFMGDVRIAILGMVAASLGLIGLGMLSPTYGFMLVWLVVYSLGSHMYMPLAPSIGMSLSKKDEYGSRLSLYSAWGLVATLAGYVVVWAGFQFLGMGYNMAFILASVFYLIAAIILTRMKKSKSEKRKIRFLFKKQYLLYYLLSIANGARKQVFLTFAPWVLITTFHLGPPQFAILGVLISIVSILSRTIVGRAIDKLGERIVLSCEAILLFIICFGYIFSEKLFTPAIAVIVMSTCYILDGSMSVVEMARSTYVKKISTNADEVTPTLSAGVSLDHIVAMTIPIFGGLLWSATGGYQSVFVAAAIIACINLFLSLKIKINTEPAG